MCSAERMIVVAEYYQQNLAVKIKNGYIFSRYYYEPGLYWYLPRTAYAVPWYLDYIYYIIIFILFIFHLNLYGSHGIQLNDISYMSLKHVAYDVVLNTSYNLRK